MKKVVLIVLIIFIVLVGMLLAIPVFFKQNILDVAQKSLNKQVNAKVELNDLKLSLIKQFPKVSAEFQDLVICGVDEFSGDTLLSVNKVKTTMNLVSLFNPDAMQVEKIIMASPTINLLVKENGKANWDVAPESAPENTEMSDTEEEENPFQLQLDKIEIRNASLVYDDKSVLTKLSLNDFNFDISGEMYGNTTQLKTKGVVNDFSLEYDKVGYISNTVLDITTALDVDLDKMKFTIAENELLINRLPLQLTGSVEMPSDTMLIDLAIETKESDFENFLALVPPVYEEYLKDITTRGSATISGKVDGIYAGENYPAFNLKMNVDNGNLQYADMPEDIKNISANVLIEKPQGELDLTTINISKAHAEIKENPVDLKLNVSTPVSDAHFNGSIIGKVNLSHLKDALPLDSVNMSGLIDANLVAIGNYSDIENEAYDKIKSDGVVVLDNFMFDSQELTQKIVVPQGKLDFSPKNINLSQFFMTIGQSDFRLSGVVTNYLNYFLKDGTLKGNFQLKSNQVNFNELLRLQADVEEVPEEKGDAKEKGAEPEEEILAFDVPENIDFTFRSDIESAIFNRIPIDEINGEIRAVNQQVVLKNLKMNMLDGELNMNGSYKNTTQNRPLFDFGIDISEFNIPLMYNTVSGMQNLVPMAGKSDGTLSSKLGIKGQLSPQLKLIASSANGDGFFSTKNLQIVDSPVFNQLSGILKKEKLQNVYVDDFIANIDIDNGSLLLKPFTTKVIGQETRVEGSLNAESLLDMRLDFNVERDAFGPDIQKILEVIPGNEKITMLPAGVVINGPVGKPKVSADLSKTTKAVADATKDDVKKSLNKLGKNILKFLEK